MPTKRTRRARYPQIIQIDDEAVRIHLKLGDCLLAGPGRGCACGLRMRDGSEDEDLKRRLLSEIPDHAD